MNLESLDFGTSSYIGMVVGGIAYFALGALWYTVLLGQRWIEATGRTREEMPSSSPVWMVATLIGAIISTVAIAIAYEWGGGDGIVDGVVVGLILGVAVVAMENLKNVVYNFDDRSQPWTLYAINSAYGIAGFVVAGAVYALIA